MAGEQVVDPALDRAIDEGMCPTTAYLTEVEEHAETREELAETREELAETREQLAVQKRTLAASRLAYDKLFDILVEVLSMEEARNAYEAAWKMNGGYGVKQLVLSAQARVGRMGAGVSLRRPPR